MPARRSEVATARAPDAVVVGAGPNGMAAALTLARAGLAVEVVEGADSLGGGCRTAELTLPGFRHDVCAAAHPLAAASPFFSSVASPGRTPRFLHPEVAYAHPLDDGRAAAVFGSVEATAGGLGQDAGRYRRLVSPAVDGVEGLLEGLFGGFRRVPRHPLALASFARVGLRSCRALAGRFTTPEGQALWGGAGSHAMAPLERPVTGSFAFLLTLLAHAVGWPVVEGGSAGLIQAVADELEAHGGAVRTGVWVRSPGDLPRVPVVVLDVSPQQLLSIFGERLGTPYRRALRRFRYGPGVCKVDWALSGPVPWRNELCRRAGTVHVGGTFEEVARAEAAVHAGRHAERPACLVVQQGVVDPSRAPGAAQTLWAYCHVPSGSPIDVSAAIEGQLERFAPGFKDLVLARSVRTAAAMEAHNPNEVGGDINGGATVFTQLLTRPVLRPVPYRLPVKGFYLCSASTPPGGGVHGMCGVAAAEVALADLSSGRL